MPAFLVELPTHPGHGLFGGANKMVVFAVDAASAVDAVQAEFDGDSNAMWNGAVATQIIAGTDLAGYELSIAVLDSSPVVDVAAKAGVGAKAVAVGAINSGGNATYAIDDILTAVGGTFTRAATFRVITVSTGVITSVEMVDPGEYTVDPTPLTANPVTGGGGDSATVDITMAAENSYEVLMGQMVTLLNATSIIANAAVDFSVGAGGARILTVASIADGIGDKIVQAQLRKNGSPVAGLLSTVVDEGISAAVLTVAIPAAASLVLPSVTPVKGV